MNWILLLTGVGSFALGFVAEKVLDWLLELVQKRLRTRKYRKCIAQSAAGVDSLLNITPIASGLTCFEKDNCIDISIPSKNYFLAFPAKKFKSTERPTGPFAAKDTWPPPGVRYEELAPGMTEEKFREMLEEARLQVATHFVNRTEGMYFNGKKYGVLRSDDFSRTPDEAETPVLHIGLFSTDYFTHRVADELSRQISKMQAAPLTLPQLNGPFSFLRTSLGINLVVEIPATNEMLMTRRAVNAAYSGGREWVYPAVTEAFTETDYDRFAQKADLCLCIKRGLLEELGIDTRLYDEGSIQIYDMYFENNYFQDGITCSVKLKDDVTLDDVLKCSGKDERLEIAEIFALPLKKDAIESFIETHLTELRPQAIFTLQSFLSRKGILLDMPKLLKGYDYANTVH